MSVSGRIAIDLEFTDRTSMAGGSSLNTITLRDAVDYAGGKVAIVSGTMTTAGISVDSSSLSYRDSAGQLVALGSVSRLAFLCSRDATATDADNATNRVRSSGAAGVSSWSPDGPVISVDAQFTAGTASYTLVLYGS